MKWNKRLIIITKTAEKKQENLDVKSHMLRNDTVQGKITTTVHGCINDNTEGDNNFYCGTHLLNMPD